MNAILAVISYPLLFLLNVAIEITVAYLIGFRSKSWMEAVFFANLLTHPLLCYLLILNSIFSVVAVLPLLAVLECAVVGVEYAFLASATGNKHGALRCSVVMNCVSFAVGLILFGLPK